MAHSHHEPAGGDIRARIRAAVAHLGHVLPGQAPIKDFVHHNTLHGFQHLPFPDALRAAREATGNQGYLPAAEFRALFAAGRITRADLEAVLREAPALDSDAVIGPLAAGTLRREDAYLAALLHPLDAITACQLSWQIEERDAQLRDRVLRFILSGGITVPKIKTHKATAKRFKLTGSGKLVRTKGEKRHLRRNRSKRSKRSAWKMFAHSGHPSMIQPLMLPHRLVR